MLCSPSSHILCHLYPLPSKNVLNVTTFYTFIIFLQNLLFCSGLNWNCHVPLCQTLFWVKWAVSDEIHLNNSHSSSVSTSLFHPSISEAKEQLDEVNVNSFLLYSFSFIPCIMMHVIVVINQLNSCWKIHGKEE